MLKEKLKGKDILIGAISIFLIVITFILVKFYKKSGGNMDDLGGF